MTDDLPEQDRESGPDARAEPRRETPINDRKRLSNAPRAEYSTKFANMSLGLDATFCNVVGLVFTLIGAFLAERLGAAGWVLTVFGVVTLLWSFMVTLYANRRVARRSEVTRIMNINVVIVALGVLVLAIPGSMTSDGKVLLAIWTAVTAGFTIAQYFARKTLD